MISTERMAAIYSRSLAHLYWKEKEISEWWSEYGHQEDLVCPKLYKRFKRKRESIRKAIFYMVAELEEWKGRETRKVFQELGD